MLLFLVLSGATSGNKNIGRYQAVYGGSSLVFMIDTTNGDTWHRQIRGWKKDFEGKNIPLHLN